MSAQVQDHSDRAAILSRRVVAIVLVLIYCPLLVLVFLTISFSADDTARTYIATAMQRPPRPLPPLPVLHAVAWPEIALRRDPFLPIATTPVSRNAMAAPAKPALVASYQDSTGPTYVIGRDAAGGLARFAMGDEFDGGTIQRIETGRVILLTDGKQRAIELDARLP